MQPCLNEISKFPAEVGRVRNLMEQKERKLMRNEGKGSAKQELMSAPHATMLSQRLQRREGKFCMIAVRKIVDPMKQ